MLRFNLIIEILIIHRDELCHAYLLSRSSFNLIIEILIIHSPVGWLLVGGMLLFVSISELRFL